jgi:1,4-dihydroxy-2-naphthoyl-CoA hydrolase
VLASIAETVASIAGAIEFRDLGQVVGVSNVTDTFITTRPTAVSASAQQVLADDEAQIWRVELRDQNDKLVATSQVRLANITSADRHGRPT